MFRRTGFTVVKACLLVGCLLLICGAYGADYYVDVDSRGGPCDDAGPGTVERPWRTLDRPLQWQNGDSVSYAYDGTGPDAGAFESQKHDAMRADSSFLPLAFAWSPAEAVIREENFDQEPAGWEGVNNRGTHFAPKIVTQDFGYSASTHHAGGRPGEIGGKINPAGEAAYYGYRLPNPLTLDASSSASGRIFVARGPGHFLLGLFNADTLNEWRTPNTLAARINGRGDGFHCHVEYCTRRWRCEAGVIGKIVRGRRIEAAEIPGGQVYEWQLAYDPTGAEGSGLLAFTLDGKTATCPVLKEHRADGATFTHFGLLPIPKTWDSAGEVWIDEVTINGRRFDFSEDPKWDERNNRRTYETKDTRPRFDFGWSPTRWAGGKAAGELGGLVFRGDCRDPNRLAAYGDRLSTLTLDTALYARGKVSMIRGVTDSTASIGFYNSTWSLRSNPRQDHSIPMDYLGINIEGPSSEGFFFYPVYRVHGDVARALGGGSGKAPRIYPDRTVHDWMLKYDPAGADGHGRITVRLDEQTCTLDLEPDARRIGASFDRFGISTPWIDGNSVTVFFDDIQYTRAPDDGGARPAARSGVEEKPTVSKPIALHPDNPHYFLFRGKPTALITSGEHYGAVLNLDFDYFRYLNELQARGFNLTRVSSGAYREVAGSFPDCMPYRLDLPIKAKKQYLIFDGSPQPKLATKEGTIPDALHLLDF